MTACTCGPTTVIRCKHCMEAILLRLRAKPLECGDESESISERCEQLSAAYEKANPNWEVR